ncbi:hypothetical protein TNCV_79121 [Trichonephila clavipes]|nr:hypothetical protein TNCV_79121 [Trichonephila clavipes]
MVISRLWKEFQITSNAVSRPIHCRLKATTPTEDGYLTINAQRHRNVTIKELVPDLATATGRTTSRQTVYRR